MNLYHFVGRIAKTPVLTRPGNSILCKFTLLSNEYTGNDDAGIPKPERVVAIPVTVFGKRAEAIAENCMEGDQLIVTLRVENNNYTDKDNVDQYDYSFILEDFNFGAPGSKKREQLQNRKAGN